VDTVFHVTEPEVRSPTFNILCFVYSTFCIVLFPLPPEFWKFVFKMMLFYAKLAAMLSDYRYWLRNVLN